jgi:hypothetical protein
MSTESLNCGDVFAHICENLDEELDSARCAGIRRHIEQCTDCSRYLASMKTTITLYKKYVIPKPNRLASGKIEELIDGGSD